MAKTITRSEFYRRIDRPIGVYSMERRKQDVLFDKKWKKFLRRARLFHYIPFIEIVFASGSMALGNVHSRSDFDVIVGAQKGRLFTVRFFSLFICDIFNWRRKKSPERAYASDKLCFNHFVIEGSYKLQPPYNRYWGELYRNLIPVIGETKKINEFWKKNSWLGEREMYRDDLRHLRKKPSLFRRFLEKSLGGRFGDRIENQLRRIELKKIKKSLSKMELGHKPRVVVNETELEFHHDTSRIEEMVKNK